MENVRKFCSNIMTNSSGNIIQKLLLISANESVMNQVQTIKRVCSNIRINNNYGRCLRCKKVSINKKCLTCGYFIISNRRNKLTMIINNEQFLKNGNIKQVNKKRKK